MEHGPEGICARLRLVMSSMGRLRLYVMKEGDSPVLPTKRSYKRCKFQRR
jgi:hypothetical protein